MLAYICFQKYITDMQQAALFMFITSTKIPSTIIKISNLYKIKPKYLNGEQDSVN